MLSSRLSSPVSESASARLISLRRVRRSSSFACLGTVVELEVTVFNDNTLAGLSLHILPVVAALQFDEQRFTPGGAPFDGS